MVFCFILVRSCTSTRNCIGNEACVNSVCQPPSCTATGYCAYGTNCNGGVCQGNVHENAPYSY